jgi:hypothetical protein
MRGDLFDTEQRILDYQKSVSVESIPREELEKRLQSLIINYAQLLEQAKFLTKVSDRLESKLVTANKNLFSKKEFLEKTLSDLRKTRRGKRAYTIIYCIAMGLFVTEEFVFEPVFTSWGFTSWISVTMKFILALMLKPAESIVETWLIHSRRDKTND